MKLFGIENLFKSQHYAHRILWVFFLGGGISFTCLADSEQVRNLRKYDEVYSNSIYASGEYTSISPPIFRRNAKTQVQTYSWRMTQGGDKKSIHLCVLSPFERSEGYGSPPHRVSYFTNTKQIVRRETTLDASVLPTDYMTSRHIIDNVWHSLDPSSDVFSLQMDMFSFALGRGFTKKLRNLDEVNDEQKRLNGETLYSFQAEGHYLSSDGIWEIQFAPSATYMVRSAKFSRKGSVSLEVETFGLQILNDCVVPEKSNVRIIISPDISILHQFVIKEGMLEFHSQFYELVNNDVAETPSEGSTVIEESLEGTKIHVVNKNDIFIAELEHFNASLFIWRVAIIAVVNIAGITLILLLYWYNHRKK